MRKKFFKTIRSQIILTTIMTCIFLSISVSAISYSFYYKTVKKNMIRTAESSLTLVGSSIDDNMQDAYSFIRNCQANSTILEFLQTPEDKAAKINASSSLWDNYNGYDGRYYIRRIAVASYNQNSFIQVIASNYATLRFQSIEDIMQQPFFNDYYHSHTYSYSQGFLTTGSGSQYLPLVRPLYNQFNSDELGFIYMEISPNVFTIPLKTSGAFNNNNFFLTLDKHNYVYTDFTLKEQNLSFEITADLSGIASSKDTIVNEMRDSSGKYVSISVPLAAKDCYITQLITVSTFYQQLFSIIAIIFGFSLLTGLILHGIFDHMINVPVHKLQDRMKSIAEGNFSRDISVEWEHELGDIGRSVNTLAEDVQSLMNQRIKDENEKREYEYKMLQSQINPHFLYNTLNSIKWMAAIQHAPGIAEMTTALSRLLKNIAKGTEKNVPLSTEIDLLNDYFTIQKYRYGGTISLSYKIDDESALTCMIPRFSLQPIVENAIFHGIEPKGTPGTILVHIFQNENAVLQIDITDDGVGMTDEQTRQLLSEKRNTKADFFKEIGISNVHKRLQFEFGPDYGLQVHSRLSEFTTVSILLPYAPHITETI